MVWPVCLLVLVSAHTHTHVWESQKGLSFGKSSAMCDIEELGAPRCKRSRQEIAGYNDRICNFQVICTSSKSHVRACSEALKHTRMMYMTAVLYRNPQGSHMVSNDR
ncbi:hypothetical protein KCU81_g496, partial [Aureobasidium melanogenum]